MRIARARLETANPMIAVIDAGVAYDVSAAGGPTTIAGALAALDTGALRRFCCQTQSLDPEHLTLLAPIDDDARVLCTGFNYVNHATESARDVPVHPTFFMRYASSLVGPGEPIVLPAASEQLDWEGEVAFVIKRAGRAIATADAMDHIGGYVCFGDHSIRDFQFHGTQATAGKNFDRSGAIGPWIVTSDEVPTLADLELFTRLDGERVQHGCLSDLVFDVPALVAYISTFMALRPGDVVATGTPAGVGARRTPPRWLRPGEEIVVDVPGLGTLTNTVIVEERTS